MALLEICNNKPFAKTKNGGFTLLELLMVIGLLSVGGCFYLFANVDGLRGSAFNADRETVLAALRRARSRAINNVCVGAGCVAGKSHGVHFDPQSKFFVIFQGDVFDADDLQNETVEFESGAVDVFLSPPADVVFESGSGNASSTEIILKDDFGREATTSINEAGRIDWQ